MQRPRRGEGADLTRFPLRPRLDALVPLAQGSLEDLEPRVGRERPDRDAEILHRPTRHRIVEVDDRDTAVGLHERVVLVEVGVQHARRLGRQETFDRLDGEVPRALERSASPVVDDRRVRLVEEHLSLAERVWRVPHLHARWHGEGSSVTVEPGGRFTQGGDVFGSHVVGQASTLEPVEEHAHAWLGHIGVPCLDDERAVASRDRRRHPHRPVGCEGGEPRHLALDLGSGAPTRSVHPQDAACRVARRDEEHAVPVVRDERERRRDQVEPLERPRGEAPESVDTLVARQLEEGLRRVAHSSIVSPSSPAAAITALAAATSCTPTPVRSQTVTCAGSVRPSASPAQTRPSSTARFS